MFNSDDYLGANEDDERYFFRDHRERPMSRRELWMVTQDHTPITGNCSFCGAQIEAPRSVVMAPCACGRYTAIRSLLADAAKEYEAHLDELDAILDGLAEAPAPSNIQANCAACDAPLTDTDGLARVMCACGEWNNIEAPRVLHLRLVAAR